MRQHTVAGLAPLVLVVVIVALLAAPALAEDYYDEGTRRMGVGIDYAFAVTTLNGQPVSRFSLSDGFSFFTLGFGFQFEEHVEIRMQLSLEDADFNGIDTRSLLEFGGGIRIHVLPGNAYNWRVPSMADVFLTASVGFASLTDELNEGYTGGTSFRIGAGIRGTVDEYGSEASGGLYYLLTFEYRTISFTTFEQGGVPLAVDDTLTGFVFLAGIGIML